MCGKRYRLAECCKVDIGIKYTYWLDFKDKNEGEKRRVERIWGGHEGEKRRTKFLL